MKINMWKLLIVALTASTLTVGCQDDRDNFMVSDSISFVGKAEELQQIVKLSVYNEEYQFPVVKNGKGQTAATVKLEASETALISYNTANGTDYAFMPKTCYEITPTVHFGEKEMRKFATIKWNPAAVTALDQSLTYVIPIELSVAGDALPLSEERNQMFIQLEFSSVSMSAITTSVANKDLVYNGQIAIDTPIATMDVKIDYAIDNSLIAAYNEANGTSYQQAPDGMASLLANTSTIAANETATTYSCKVSTSAVSDNLSLLQNGGGYVIPVRITSITDGVSIAEEVSYVVIADKEVKGPWAVLEGHEIGYAFDPNPPSWSVAAYTGDRLFDGVHANEWIPFFNSPNTFPMVFVADMGQGHIFTKFIISDSYNYQGAARDYQIFVAETYNGANTEWTLVASGMRDYGYVNCGTDKADPRLIYNYPIQKVAAGRYLKFVILKCENYYGAASQAIGQCKLGDVQGLGL